MKHALKYLVLSTLIFILGVLTDQAIFRTSRPVAASSESTTPAPAIYFLDVDGDYLNAKETQAMLDGECGPTPDAVCFWCGSEFCSKGPGDFCSERCNVASVEDEWNDRVGIKRGARPKQAPDPELDAYILELDKDLP